MLNFKTRDSKSNHYRETNWCDKEREWTKWWICVTY